MKRTLLLLVFALGCLGRSGAQWIPQNSGTQINISGIHFTSADTGFITTDEIGDTAKILRTINGGTSWTVIHRGPYIESFSNIYFVNKNKGFVGGYAYNTHLLKTTNDGGLTWSNYTGTAIPIRNILSIDFLNSTYGFLTGSGTRVTGMKTKDGGATWTPMMPAPDTLSDYSRILFLTPDTGLLVGPSTTGMMRTTDTGNSWTAVTLPLACSLQDMHFLSPSMGIAIGKSMMQEPAVLKTTTRGTSWTKKRIPMTYMEPIKVQLFPSGMGYIAGYTWADTPAILKTTDFGETWTRMTMPAGVFKINDLHFPTEKVGYCAGSDGKIMKLAVSNNVVQVTNITPLKVYPNPATDLLHWDTSDKTVHTVHLYSMDGKQLRQADYHSGSMRIDDLPAGTYLLHIGNRNMQVVKN